MRIAPALVVSTALAFATLGAARAQAPAPDLKTFASSAEIQALLENARKVYKPGPGAVVQPVVSLAPFKATMEYRRQAGPFLMHPKDGELNYVVAGKAAVTVGGTLVQPKAAGSGNVIGQSIEGGTIKVIQTGDWLIVPAGAPHEFNPDGEYAMVTIKAPN